MLVGPSRSPSWLGLSIPFDNEKEENLSPLAPDRACFGPDELIPNGSSAYLKRTKGF